ncbi:D-ribose pyranase [Ferrimonas balearica]|uniref:D-ribose pyranase n=1 Tax=Ferrimonas balearica TaxID=44012 RepID=UPI001C58BBE4|nr:D-ribose pyranase [Ferrimonas balearica]MBW3140092.1 D-ribose pyranase [Ferrimonas balearica]MBY6106800.1 D-ribose pyranase [Ferrimonas balearica]
MKRGALLNSHLSQLISLSGHTDELTIADAGLPIPDECQRIDLALIRGVPTFLDTLNAIAGDLQIESVVLAEEMQSHSPALLAQLTTMLEQLGQAQGQTIAIEWVSHEQFKQRSRNSRAVVRTGECQPYANIILKAGVAF